MLMLVALGCGKNGGENSSEQKTAEKKALSDGEYTAKVTFSGGSGKARVEDTARIKIEGGKIYATIVWSSSNYDYMIVDGNKYMNEAAVGENSTFTIPVSDFSVPQNVIGDTTAMSTPHEIEYTLTFELVKESSLIIPEIKYAERFTVSEYEGCYLVNIEGENPIVVVPEGMDTPKNTSDMTVLKRPLTNSYLLSSSQYDLIDEIGAADYIKYTGIKENDWYIQEAKERLQDGRMIYAGKYSAPDYELLLSGKASVALENTMIYHSPDIKEKLEELGIPVFVEKSSQETHPLGRLEWIKLYGILYGKESEANTYFETELSTLLPIIEKESTGKTAAVFSVNSQGLIVIRKPGDYISKMVGLAGGTYLPDKVQDMDENALSTMKIQLEDFYAAAKDADVLIYNSTIEGELSSIEELIGKNVLFKDFKAVKEGKVYCTESNFFQETTGICVFIEDLNSILSEEENDKLVFLKKLY